MDHGGPTWTRLCYVGPAATWPSPSKTRRSAHFHHSRGFILDCAARTWDLTALEKDGALVKPPAPCVTHNSDLKINDLCPSANQEFKSSTVQNTDYWAKVGPDYPVTTVPQVIGQTEQLSIKSINLGTQRWGKSLKMLVLFLYFHDRGQGQTWHVMTTTYVSKNRHFQINN